MAKRKKFKELSSGVRDFMIKEDRLNKTIHSTNMILGVQKKKNKAVILHAHTGFYSDQEAANLVLQDMLNRANIAPVVFVDPSTIKTEQKLVTPSEKAFFLARKYRFEDESRTLNAIFLKHKNKEMSRANIEIVNRIVASIKATRTGPVDN